MNTKVLKSLFFGLFLFFTQACVNESYENCPTVEEEGKSPVTFVSDKSMLTRTESDPVEGTQWVVGDTIGIYMMLPAGEISNSLEHNKKYMAQAAGKNDIAFSAVDDANRLYYPDNTASYKFIAYYPYKREVAGEIDPATFKYPVNVSNQNDPAAIDVLYSDNVVSHSKPQGNVSLEFKHVLSKVVINVMDDGNLVYDKMRTTYHGIPATAEMDLWNGGNTNNSPTPITGDVSNILGNIGPLSNFDFKGIGKPWEAQDSTSATLKPPTTPAPASTVLYWSDFDTTYQAIVIPHSIKTTPGEETVTFFSGGNRQFQWDLSTISGAFPALEPNKVYTFWIMLTGDSPILIQGSITDWVAEDGGYVELPESGIGKTATFVFPNGADSLAVSYIPKGGFWMGDWRLTKATKHRVTIPEGYQISRYMVTNEQFVKFANACGIGQNGQGTDSTNAVLPGSKGKSLCSNLDSNDWGIYWDAGLGKWRVYSNGTKNKYPATAVSWWGARAYARWAGGSYGGNDPDPANYHANGDIPTEAQWEYAARGGVDTTYCYIDSAHTAPGEYGSMLGAQMSQYAVATNGGTGSSAVGTKLPNGYGLYDMFGNMWEYTRELYSSSTIADYPGGANPVTDYDANAEPSAAILGGTAYPVVRGGHYNENAASSNAGLKIGYRTMSSNFSTTASKTEYYCSFRVIFKASK
jgi:formylglycine-generating enzyme required for sulfatase activity